MQKDPARVARRLLPACSMAPTILMAHPRAAIPRRSPSFGRADLVSFAQRWLRPDNAKIFIVSDRPLSEIQPLLEARFGNWAPPAVNRGIKSFPAAAPRPVGPRILLINRPGAPQSSILGAELLPIDPKGDIIPFDTANDVLGGDFNARLNMDLRERRAGPTASAGTSR